MAKKNGKSSRNSGGMGLDSVANAQFQHTKQAMELTPVEQKAFGLIPTANEELRRIRQAHAKPYVALKYYDADYECFSEWGPEPLKGFSALTAKLAGMTWQQIQMSGGALGHKTGLGYTHLDLSTVSEKAKLRLKRVQDQISPEISFFELRVNQVARVHGFRSAEAFFLVLLDQEHNVYPGK